MFAWKDIDYELKSKTIRMIEVGKVKRKKGRKKNIELENERDGEMMLLSCRWVLSYSFRFSQKFIKNIFSAQTLFVVHKLTIVFG